MELTTMEPKEEEDDYEQKLQKKRAQNKKHVSLSKRSQGLLKKAAKFSAMFDAKLAIVILSPAGRPSEFGHPSACTILNRYLQIEDNNYESLPDHEQAAVRARELIDEEIESCQTVEDMVFLRDKYLLLLQNINHRLEKLLVALNFESGYGDHVVEENYDHLMYRDAQCGSIETMISNSSSMEEGSCVSEEYNNPVWASAMKFLMESDDGNNDAYDHVVEGDYRLMYTNSDRAQCDSIEPMVSNSEEGYCASDEYSDPVYASASKFLMASDDEDDANDAYDRGDRVVEGVCDEDDGNDPVFASKLKLLIESDDEDDGNGAYDLVVEGGYHPMYTNSDSAQCDSAQPMISNCSSKEEGSCVSDEHSDSVGAPVVKFMREESDDEGDVYNHGGSSCSSEGAAFRGLVDSSSTSDLTQNYINGTNPNGY